MRFLKKMAIQIASLSLVVFAAPSIWNGSADVSWYESSAQAYNLINAEQLAGLAKLVNEGTSDFEGKTITLGADIFLNDTTGADAGSWYNASHRSWIPIGTTSRPFKGEFDGIAGKKNRKIYGLYINSSSTNYAGLFGYTSNVKISNLDVLVGKIVAKDNVGSLIGYAEGGSVTNVHAEARVNGNNRVGGLIGYFTGSISKSSEKGAVAGRDSVGGLVGFTAGTIYSAFHVDGLVSGRNFVGGMAGSSLNTIRDSYSEGNVLGNGDFIGGLVGWLNYTKNSSTVTYILDNSYVDGDVQGVNYVGGLIGCDSISGYGNRGIKKSYADGSVAGKTFVGGVLGSSGRGVSSGQYHTIESSYHTGGNVIGDSSYIGGLVGITYGTILDSYNIGNVNGVGSGIGGLAGTLVSGSISSCSSIGNVEGSSHIGGLIGSGGSIDNSYAEGDVKGASDYVGGVAGSSGNVNKSYHTVGKVEGHAYVGGLAGNAGSVDSSYSEGNVVGAGCYVGGLVGNANKIRWSYHANGNVDGDCNVGGLAGVAKDSVMKSSHTVGNVIGDASYVGGLIGQAKGIVISSYHKKGDVSGTYYVGGLIGETKASIIKSYSECDVIGNYDNIGGLAGSFYRVTDTIKVSANDSNYISESYSLGNVEGRDYVGGLVGYFYRSVKTTGAESNDSSYVKDSYSVGNVKGNDYVGGLIGSETVYKKLSRNQKNGIDTTYNYIGAQYVGMTIKQYSSQIKSYVINSYSKGRVDGRSYVGGLIGLQLANSDSSDKYVSESFIAYNIYNSTHSEGDVVANGDYVGGLIGRSLGTIDLSVHTDGDVSGSSYVGGLAGYNSSVIKNSYSEGNVLGKENNVGGLVGQGLGEIINSHSRGNVSGRDSVGGLIGSMQSRIRATYAEAEFVEGRNSVGGLVGTVIDFIDGSHFEGDSVTGVYQVGGLAGYAAKAIDSSYSTASVKGDDNVGGLVGSAYGNVSNSYATGNIIGDVEHSSAGNDNLGGLVGYQYSGFISKSMALGNVYGTTKLGGLVGRFEGTSISQSYANGDVTGGYYGDPSDEIGNYYIGGLVGYAKGTISESYASGVVMGIENEPVYTGCIVGYVKSSLSVTKTYYDKIKCNLGIDGGENVVSVTGDPAKTTEEMKTQSTFVDWDFTNTWRIEDNTYPFLQIYANSLINAVVLTESLKGFEYDGLPKTPQVKTVMLFGGVLTEITDYTVEYEKNINAGTAKISVCGLNLYGGCQNIEFEIAPMAIQPTISAIEDVVYTGLAITPEISVYNGETLLEASDYTVEYSDNVNAGTASVAITMKGNYSGSVTKTFMIEKANPVITQNPSASDITVGMTLALSDLADGAANVPGSFAWKNPEVIPAIENTGYEVVFTPNDEVNYNSAEITVPVKVWDVAYVAIHIGEKTLDSVVVVKGTNYTLPTAPDSIGYDFVGFFQGNSAIGGSGDVISVNENTVLDAKYSVKIFAVNFVNGTIELQSDNLPYGSLPKYTGNIPVKTSTAKYTYTFNGWNPAIETVSKSATYTAVFDSVVNKYEITFVNGNTVLQSSEVEYGTLPTPPTVSLPENTAQYTYSFDGWDRDIVAVTGATTYSAIINQTVNKYSVVFKDYNGMILKNSVKYNYGTSAADIVKPANPIRSSSAQYAYTFNGWSPTISEVTKDAEYVAEYDSTLRNYTIAFVSGTEILQSTNVDYGIVPTYDGDTPIKASSAKYTYTFKGWSPAIETVSKSATYTAEFDSVVNKYKITFVDGNMVLQSSEIEYGTLPTPPTVSLPENTAQYTYSFDGWDRDIVAVTGVATYSAVINQTVNKYSVVFKDYNGMILKNSVKYNYGTSAADIVKPANPIRSSSAQYAYTFKGWSPTISEVTKDAEYVAEYDSTLRNYTIAFVSGSDTLQFTNVDYGLTPVYKGMSPTKVATDQYIYTFKGWNPAISNVVGDAVYTALFDSTLRTYTITFINGSETLQSSDFGYGMMPSYKGNAPTKKETKEYIYTFKGWNPTITAVTGKATYKALFDSTLQKYTVVFKNGNDKLQTISVAYGETPKYTGKTPTKKSTNDYSYEFVGWSPKLGPIIKNTEFVAVFDSTKVTGMQNVRQVGSNMSVNVVSTNIQISAAPIGKTYALIDMQGRILQKGNVESANFNIITPSVGSYFIRIDNQIRKVNVR